MLYTFRIVMASHLGGLGVDGTDTYLCSPSLTCTLAEEQSVTVQRSSVASSALSRAGRHIAL